ncbi:MAG: DegT/DnrJ/EryC1/StrS family aminotransferase [Eubacteriales bacterium]|nr:DegT/DnrJ/EryC1/StrS family aminotransferase [Eubacteriales bacterium]
MNGKKIYLSKPSIPPFEEFINEIRPIWEDRMFTNVGERHRKFELELCSYLKSPYISLTANGHMALELALETLDLSGEVITSPFTFASTIMSLLRLGLTPVFCDIAEKDLLIDTEKIEKKITAKTSAIMPIHLFGNICDVERIDQICCNHGLVSVYDGAHAFGVKYKGVYISNFGDACMHSFHATKVFHSIEGGAVCFKKAEHKKRADVIRNFGLVGDEVECRGFNGKMTDVSAAMGICNLHYIAHNIENRKRCALHYDMRLSEIKGIRPCVGQVDVDTNFSYYPIVVEPEYGLSRDQLCDYLNANGVFPRKYYVNVANRWEIIKSLGLDCECPIAERMAQRILVLPLHQDLSLEDVDYICDLISKLKS